MSSMLYITICHFFGLGNYTCMYMNVFGKEEKDYGGGLYKKWLSRTKEKEKLRDVNRGEENIINTKNLGHAWLM